MAKKPLKGESNGTAKPGDEPAPKACYVLSLEIENFRCFGPKQKLSLTDNNGNPTQWTIILGENGTGKTTLLQLLTSFELMQATTTIVQYNNTETHEPRFFSTISDGFISGDRKSYSNVLRADNNNREAVCRLAFTKLIDICTKATRSTLLDSHWKMSDQLATCHWETISPRFYAYGISRRLQTYSRSRREKDDPVVTLFDNDVSLRDAEDWLLRLDYAAKTTRERTDEVRVEQVKHLLMSILPEKDGELQFQTTTGANPHQWVEFKTFSGWVPLRRLGHGYQTLVAWVLDFVSRMVERYPDSPDPLKEPAIVIVDEIDLHLHPAWQRKLIAFLTERFSNTQFIVTAHSPLIVQAVEDANIVVLKRVGDHVEIINDPDEVRGWGVDQILTSNLFDLKSARPPHVEKLFARKQELIDKPHPTVREKHELKQLQQKIDTLPIGDSASSVREMDAIRKALDLLMKSSPA